MSKTYRRQAANQPPDPRKLTIIEEDEDTDPRSYNVLQRSDQEWDSLRVEEALSE